MSDVFDPRRMVRVRNEHDAAEMTFLQEPRRRRERLPRRAAVGLAQDGVLRYLVIVEILRADARFGETVTGLFPARHDDDRSNAPPVQVDGVIETGGEDLRRPAVELGRTEHDDRVRGSGIVA